MTTFDDSQIIRSWGINALPWIKAIKNKEIESRIFSHERSYLELIIEDKRFYPQQD